MIFYDVHKFYRELKASKDKRGFVMHVSDHETNADSDSDNDVEADNSLVVSRRRFACDELYMRFVLYYIFS